MENVLVEVKCAVQEKEYSRAKELLLSSLPAGAESAEVIYQELSNVCFLMNDYVESAKYYSLLISQFPVKTTWLYKLGYCEFKQKNWNIAANYFSQLLATTPNHVPSIVKLSQCFLNNGKLETAFSIVENALASNVSAELLAQKSHILSRDGKLQHAIASYDETIELAQNENKVNPLWLVRQADCYIKLHDTENAIRCYSAALDKAPDKANWHAALAVLYAKTEQTGAAITAYQHAVTLDDQHADWFADLGRLLADTDKEAAIAAYQKSVELGRKALSYEIAVLSCDGQSVQHLAPEVLFTARRFDLCVKLMYAQSLLGLPAHNSAVNAEELYLRHIHLRTKGNEPDNLAKTTLQDYQQDFAKLLASIQQQGFDEHHAIPLAQDGVLLNGAHRSAAAVALQLDKVPVVFMDKPQGIGWDFNWFMQRGFNLDELNELLLCWFGLNPTKGNIIILWPAVAEHWESMTADIAAEVQLVTERTLSFTELGMSELIKDIYSMDKVAEFMPNIMAKVANMAGYEPKVRVLVVHGDSQQVNALKVKLRQHYDSIIPEQLFCTLHASANHAETMHLAHIFFHQPTLALLQRRIRPLSAHLCTWLAEAKQALLQRGASVLDGCVVGGAVLDAYEVRKADDLDMTVSAAVREAHFTVKASPLTDNVDIVNKDYAKSVSGVISDDTLLADRALHLYIRGFKFAALDVVRKRKAYSQREKDLVDLAKISEFFWQDKL